MSPDRNDAICGCSELGSTAAKPGHPTTPPTLHRTSWSNTETFPQRFFTCSEHWKPGGAVFFYVGNEANVLLYLNHTGERASQWAAASGAHPLRLTLDLMRSDSIPATIARLMRLCQSKPTTGLMWELASKYNALLVFAEHRLVRRL